jgi:hypothetical protein
LRQQLCPEHKLLDNYIAAADGKYKSIDNTATANPAEAGG